MEKSYDIIVVGAGAAGLVAAGRAAELGAKVLLLEKMERAGRKLLITGKGRCNITNNAPQDEFLKHIHPNSRFLRHAFATFFASDIIRLLNDHGCATVVERGGRVFPASNLAANVVKALLDRALHHGVELRLGHKVEELIVLDDRVTGLIVRSRAGQEIIHAANLIVCTGGISYAATGSDGDGYRFAVATGHAIEAPRPALVPLETAGDLARRLQGLSLRNVTARVWVNGKKAKEAFGEMCFTEFGVSGPIILTLSRFIVDELRNQNQVELSVDLKPALDHTKLDLRLVRDLTEHGKNRMDALFRKWLPAPMVPVALELSGIAAAREGHQLTSKERARILRLLKDFRLVVTGHRPFKEAIITAGGVRTTQIDPSTMESKLIKHLHFAGEVLDLDADTGGYNLQIAFSTGWLAAEACLKSQGR